MEAMAMGKPVIGTAIPGIMELIEDGRTGLLVPEKSPRKLADAVNSLIADQEKYRRISESAKELVIQDYSAERGAMEYESLYKVLAE